MTEVKDEYQPVTGGVLEELNSHVEYIKQMFSEQCDFDFGYNLESIEAVDAFINTTYELLDDDSKNEACGGKKWGTAHDESNTASRGFTLERGAKPVSRMGASDVLVGKS